MVCTVGRETLGSTGLVVDEDMQQSNGSKARVLLGAAALAAIVGGCQSAGPTDGELAATIERFRARHANRAREPRWAARTAGRHEHSAELGTLVAAGPMDYSMLALMLEDTEDETDQAEQGDDAPETGETRGRTKRPAGLQDGFWATVKQDLRDSPRELWDDTKASYWNGKNALVLVLAGGASLALRPEVDDDIEDKYDRSRSLSTGWGDAAGVLGNPATHFGLAAAAYTVSVLRKDAEDHERAKTLLSALIVNGASTMLLKAAANTEAPNGENFGWPSGHTSSTVTLAAVLDEYYGPWVGIPLYGLAGLVAFERLDDREHHFSDVVFGAALGYIIGKSVVRNHKPMVLGGEITPYIDPTSGASGIAWVRSTK